MKKIKEGIIIMLGVIIIILLTTCNDKNLDKKNNPGKAEFNRDLKN